MRHSNITKVYFGAPRAYRYIDCKLTRTRTRETRAHAHERTKYVSNSDTGTYTKYVPKSVGH